MTSIHHVIFQCSWTGRSANTKTVFRTFLPAALALALHTAPSLGAEPLPGTERLSETGDLSARMVSGIHRFLDRRTALARENRERFWDRDLSSPEALAESVASRRERLAEIIGAVDSRLPVEAIEYRHTSETDALVAETDTFSVYAVRWPVFDGVYGEGLLLEPKQPPVAGVVALPDADQQPEAVAGISSDAPREHQYGRRLAASGCRVVIPALVNRQDTWSGNPDLDRFTNQPHREWIYRQAFQMGRHIIGYEVQKVRAAVDWLDSQKGPEGGDLPIGVTGYAEGALLTLYTAALDRRVDTALVSGYFERRDTLWQEPIYRNLFGLLKRFGDAEIAALVSPRHLVIEHSPTPTIEGPPPERNGRSGAAPGQWSTPEWESVQTEWDRTQQLLNRDPAFTDNLTLIHGRGGQPVGPFSSEALRTFLAPFEVELAEDDQLPSYRRHEIPDAHSRQRRQVKELEAFTQRLWRRSERSREGLWHAAEGASPEQWPARSAPFKDRLWDEVIGRLPDPDQPANPRTRRLKGTSDWTLYEVRLDVWEDVFAWGYLLVPKGIAPDERRPVVVCQHGLEGLPGDVVTRDPEAAGYRFYKGFAAELADRGFVTYAPHNPYRGGDRFRTLQRKANPLGKSLFSVILGQHQQTLNWLSNLDFVDPDRIGFYGLSYGGKTAMRVPALLDEYALSICSADFNEWIWKNVTVHSAYSYMFTGEYEMPEFNLGHTFNYAEMAALIAPRPFMVERGHHDGVAPDRWVAYEYAKVRRFYTRLGLADRTRIEFFDGGHTINGQGTFEFLHEHLDWPQAKPTRSSPEKNDS